ncbi:MAG: hypothetical protein P8X65_14570 [Syntrophobacterales bacterium]|jgi:hypothetical protein
MGAQFVDALMGYEYYLEKRGKVNREEVNKHLKGISRRPISERMFTHYKKLMSQGFTSYIPINQFDVSRTLGKIQIVADRRRYLREDSFINAQVSRDTKKWIPAIIRNKSVVGFGMLTHHKLNIKRGNIVWVRIDGYKDIPTFLVWKKRGRKS